MSLNRVTIAGRLAKDLELRTTQSGVSVASFTLAVDGDFKDKQAGDRPVYWIDCIAWRQTAEFMYKYLSEKGRVVVVDGRLQTRTWTDKDGNKRKSVEVVADHVYFGDSKRDQTSDGCNAPDNGYCAPTGQDQFADIGDDDGELPF